MDTQTDAQFTVFEIANASARELYLGFTPLIFSNFLAKMRENPPGPVEHWGAADDITYRGLEFALPPNAAREYLSRHLRTLDRPGWRLILDPDAQLGRARRRSRPPHPKARRQAQAGLA